MSSALSVSEGVAWMPRTWVFEVVLERTANVIEPSDEALAHYLREPIGHFPYMNFRSFDQQRFNSVAKALHVAYENALEEGDESFSERAYYFKLMHDFSQLKALMPADPRSEKDTFQQGLVVIGEGPPWSVPGWANNLVLEIAAVDVNHAVLSSMLLSGRTHATGHCDLSSIDKSVFCRFVEAADWIYAYYKVGFGRISRDTRIFPVFASYVRAFHYLVHADTCAHDCSDSN